MNKLDPSARARKAALFNLLATPGIGSLIGRRWIVGSSQLVMALASFALICVWCREEVNREWQEAMNFVGAPPPPVPHTLLVVGIVIFVLAWVWSLLTSLSLFRASSQIRQDEMRFFSAGQIKLAGAGIQTALATVPYWKHENGIISRQFTFVNFPAAIKFVNAVARIAEQVQHHPNMDIRWNKVTLALTTHDAGGLTEKDFILARQYDALSVG